jgi:hypothetical protein
LEDLVVVQEIVVVQVLMFFQTLNILINIVVGVVGLEQISVIFVAKALIRLDVVEMDFVEEDLVVVAQFTSNQNLQELLKQYVLLTIYNLYVI